MKLVIFGLFYLYIAISQAARILGVFPYPLKSRFICGNAILKSLAEVGHEITVITSFPKDSAKENFNVVDLSESMSNYVGQSSVEDFSEMTSNEIYRRNGKIDLFFCEKIINMEYKEASNFNKKMFDVILIETSCVHRCYYGIFKKFEIPIIGVITQRTSIIGDWDVSNPMNPAVIPFELGRSGNLKIFFNRLWNSLDTLKVMYYWKTTIRNFHFGFYEKYMNIDSSFEEFMKSKPSLVFVNSHSSYFPRALNPNVVEIGGIHINRNQTLPPDIQKFLDEAEHGVILFTFGSVVRASKLPECKIQAFKQAFAEIPQRVIWKYEEPLEVSNNVITSNWLPQNDILGHKKVKAFISHCGQGAMLESLHNGVPIISVPLFVDQYSNANIFEHLEIAIRLDYSSITKENILKVLNEIVNNTKYIENMKKLSYAFRDRPMTPQQTVIYWTEYVIKHKGASHLVSPAVQLNWFQYLLLDVIGVIVTIVFAVFFVIYRTLKLIHYLKRTININKLRKWHLSNFLH